MMLNNCGNIAQNRAILTLQRPKEYIDERISHYIDAQHCDQETGSAINMSEASDKEAVKSIWDFTCAFS